MQKDFYNNEIENTYSKATDVKYRRNLGQFFTPYKVAQFMAEWILGNKKDNVEILDPAAGLGIFERAIKEQNKTRNIRFDLWEIDKNISNKLENITKELNINSTIYAEDFLEKSSWNKKYDGIIANPPYYKHHNIKNKEKIFQDICIKTYFQFSIQTNIYCWFLIKSMNLLNDSGRLAFIVPSEFFNANYGEKVKEFLKQSGIVLHLININFKENVFDNALTTSVIIFAEKNKKRFNEINFYNVNDINQLSSLNLFLNNHKKKTIQTSKLDSKVKWRNYFNGYNNKNKNKKLVLFTKFGRFSRGIATGSNQYFTLSEQEKNEFKITEDCLIPCITKANQVKDIIFKKSDFLKLKSDNKKIYLFNGEGSDDESCKDYIKRGENLEINQKYLTKKRNPWYSLEKRKIAKIWVSVFGRKGLKFIWNDTKCLNLTCFHGFYPTSYGEKYLNIIFLYLNTETAKKLFDKEKREYGNGLEKFEPNDINKSFVIDFDLLDEDEIKKLSALQEALLNSKPNERNKILEEANKIFKNYV